MTKLTTVDTPERLLLCVVSHVMQLLHPERLMSGLGPIVVKGDGSLCTSVDVAVERAVHEYVTANWLGSRPISFLGEEFGLSGEMDPEGYLLILDPADGTRALANRDVAGFAVIPTVYDLNTRRIVASAVARPGTGEVWIAMHGKTYYCISAPGSGALENLRECKVWQFKPAFQRPTVYVDNANLYYGGRNEPLLGLGGLEAIDTGLRKLEWTKLVSGSTGLNHAHVVRGGPVVGTLNLSGQPHDFGGLLLVENAGGCSAAFRLSDDRRELQEADPHRDLVRSKYDFLVTACDQRRLNKLTELLGCAVAAN